MQLRYLSGKRFIAVLYFARREIPVAVPGICRRQRSPRSPPGGYEKTLSSRFSPARDFFVNETTCPKTYFVYFEGKVVHSYGKRSAGRV